MLPKDANGGTLSSATIQSGTLVPVDYDTAVTTTSAARAGSLGTLTFNQSGTYYYNITETDPSGNWAIDGALTHKLTIVVAPNATTGALEITSVSWDNANDTTSTSAPTAKFYNKYTPTKPVKSETVNDTTTDGNGTSVKAGDTIHYKVTYKNVGDTAAKMVITDKVPTGTTYVAGTAATDYDAAKATIDDSGSTISWTLAEVPAGATVTATFDVTVNDDAVTRVDNTASGKINDGLSVDTNTVTNPLIAPVTVEPSLTKAYEGDSAPDSTFTFTLTQVSNTIGLASNPMLNGSDVKAVETSVTGQSSSEFGVITFTRPGTYVYKVTENNDGQAGWTYDSETFMLTYVVEQDGRGLKQTKTIMKADGAEVDSVTFTNTYTKTTPNPNPPKVVKKTPFTGDETPMGAMAVLVLTAGALLLASGAIRKRRDRRSQS